MGAGNFDEEADMELLDLQPTTTYEMSSAKTQMRNLETKVPEMCKFSFC